MTRPSLLRWQIKSDYLAALAVSLAPLVYFWPALREGRVLSPDDGVIFNVPLRMTVANVIRSGYLPLWNPYIFSGLPLHGSAQAGTLFPLNWFYLISSPRIATNLMMIATYMVAAIGAYLYARRAGADIAGAIGTSLVWQWCAFMVEHIGHTNIVHTAALMPWVLWAVDGYIANGTRARGLLLTGLLALQFFAGHQQTFTYSLLLTVAYAIAMTLSLEHARKKFISLLIFIILGLTLAAVQILPTFEMLRNSLRASATYNFFTAFSWPPRFALNFFAPYVLGGGSASLYHAPYIERPFFGEYSAYVGILTLMLATAAVVTRRDKRTRFWAIVFVLALILALGRFIPFHLYFGVYLIPVLNLFRAPARHLMEVQFALAVLAGRGLTALRASRKSNLITVTIIAGTIFLLTWSAVTWLRPSAFRLAREVPVTVLRAPELFIPIFVAVLSAVALIIFARSRKRFALMALFAVLALDLFLYGHGCPWRTHSADPTSELWREPEAVKLLRQLEPDRSATYRILTQDLKFEPQAPIVTQTPDGTFIFPLQPDIYMPHGIHNAAGYDGFSLTRYSRMADEMKIWGELTDAENSLRGNSRAIDMLNVRYLIARRQVTAPSQPAGAFPAATATFQGQSFDANDLGLSPAKSGTRLLFSLPATEVDRIALLTNLAWSNQVSDHEIVAHLELRTQGGKTFGFEVRAGDHTSEWAHDRADIRKQIKHQRAPVGASALVEDASGAYEAHTYVSVFQLPAKALVTSGSITVASLKHAPELSLNLARITLANGNQAFPLRREWITHDSASNVGSGTPQSHDGAQRWKKVAETPEVDIFENAHALPRVWLASETRALPEDHILNVIRSGKLPDGQAWEPRRVVLLEGPIDFKAATPDPNASAAITSHEPNRVNVKTRSTSPSILVLSENHYPGWRSYVDGQLVETMRVNYNLRGVALAPGEHSVEFVYRPKSVFIGAFVSLLTLIGLVLWWRRLLPEG